MNKKIDIKFIIPLALFILSVGCNQKNKTMDQDKYQLIVLAPGHFHAALVQKTMNEQIDSTVKVYASEGEEVEAYLKLIHQYNTRSDNPTAWKEEVYTGADYFEKMLQNEQGNKRAIVVLAGNNKKKSSYIKRSVASGLNVFSDKPMVINPQEFDQLKEAFKIAKKNKVLLYDIMTERYVITNILQKAFSEISGIFGQLQKGTVDSPAVVFEGTHHFYKDVSGKPLIRPDWYFDVKQQGEGIVDVTTHYIDLIQWECFPKTVFDYKKDVQMLSARHWPTTLTLDQFNRVTGEDHYPEFLKSSLKDRLLEVYANGEINYTLKGVHVRVKALWKYEAPKGSGDTFQSMLRGTKASIVIKQGKEQNFVPTLYILPNNNTDKEWEAALKDELKKIQKQYPGVSLEKTTENGWQVDIPQKYKIGHEQHFALVLKKYLQYLQDGNMPKWEKSFMLTKYYTTMEALEKAKNQ